MLKISMGDGDHHLSSGLLEVERLLFYKSKLARKYYNNFTSMTFYETINILKINFAVFDILSDTL